MPLYRLVMNSQKHSRIEIDKTKNTVKMSLQKTCLRINDYRLDVIYKETWTHHAKLTLVII